MLTINNHRQSYQSFKANLTASPVDKLLTLGEIFTLQEKANKIGTLRTDIKVNLKPQLKKTALSGMNGYDLKLLVRRGSKREKIDLSLNNIEETMLDAYNRIKKNYRPFAAISDWLDKMKYRL